MSPVHTNVLSGGQHWPQRPKRVTVLGAGVAGLVAAHELERLGHSVQVLEARLEVGGRVRTHAFVGRGPLAELGAMRIPASHHRTMQWIDLLGLSDRVRQFRTLFSDDASYLETHAGHLRVREATSVLVEEFRRGLPAGEYREESVLAATWLTASVNAVAPGAFRTNLHSDLNLELLDLLDGIDVRPYFVSTGGIERLDVNRFFAGNPRFAARSRLAHFFDDITVETSSALFRLEGGMDQITVRLAESLRGPVHRGRQVVGLHVRPDGVVVETRRGLDVVASHCDYVLCTVPFSVVRRMNLSGLDDDKLATVHDMQYWPATKIAVHCKDAFWESDGISGGGSFTGGLVRQTYYPPVESDPRLGAALLASYTIGPDADALARISPEQRERVVLDELGRIHPELKKPGMVLDVVTQAWGEDFSSMGAASVRWSKDVATSEEERALAAKPQGTLFFAGEHCSTYPAWIEGAIESGLAAAQEIHAGTTVERPLVASGYRRMRGGAA
ncbi:monoamine oxidase [Lentzea waywayandensis]|uniref:Monoamine oxidase n=1 Tax=Lentzea waywayandensis TaxID=84724 RepID=A0A1I6DEI0_9PSEU|nr:NAD(P)/FAD-dependent oxidoreductase [Lentzea waywayandensis]SFR03712.1 monoamine oxidase [Lentzea waywayandensis]